MNYGVHIRRWLGKPCITTFYGRKTIFFLFFCDFNLKFRSSVQFKSAVAATCAETARGQITVTSSGVLAANSSLSSARGTVCLTRTVIIGPSHAHSHQHVRPRLCICVYVLLAYVRACGEWCSPTMLIITIRCAPTVDPSSHGNAHIHTNISRYVRVCMRTCWTLSRGASRSLSIGAEFDTRWLTVRLHRS